MFLFSKYDSIAKCLPLTICYRIVEKIIVFKTINMIKYLYVLCLATLFGCVSNPSYNTTLGVIDLSGNYPTRKVDLKEIADLEYIQLETTDSSLLSSVCADYFISDDYIITSDAYTGDVFVFTRLGHFLHKFNKRGNGPEEYTNLSSAAVDFETEEFLIHDGPRKKVVIYSFEGVYKRSFPWMISNLRPWYNLNKDFLIGYHRTYSEENQQCTDTHPYYLMNKENGKLTYLDLIVPNGISNTLVIIKEKLGQGETYVTKPHLPIYPLQMNGNEALIADFALDTLYFFKEGSLSPLAVKTVSARSTNPPTVLAPELYTDSFLFFRLVPIYYDESYFFKPYDESVKLIWNRKTNQVEDWDIYNSDFDVPITKYPLTRFDNFSNRNMGVAHYTSETLIGLYNEGKLKGKLKEIASKLDEEDNYVLLIAKYK